MRPLLKILICALSFSLITPVNGLQIHEITTPKGLKAWFVEDKSVPVVSLAFAFEGGSANVPRGQEGIDDFAADLLLEGAGDLDAHAFKEKLEELGIQMSFSTNSDYFNGSIRTTLDNRFEAFKLLKSVLMTPRLDPHSINLVRERLVTDLRNFQKQPDYLIKQRIRAEMYKGHPYGRPQEGTLTSLTAIKKEDIQKYLAQEFNLQNLKIVVCGNLAVKEVQSMLDQIFATLPKQGTTQKLSEAVVQFPGRVLIDKGPFPQSVCTFLQQGLSAQDPNYTKLALLSDIMGGKSSSRLYLEVREKRGFAYSVNTSNHNLRSSALFGGDVGSENARIKDAITIIRTEWQKLAKGEITAQELKDAKQALLGSFAFGFSDTLTTAHSLLSYQVNGFTPQYIYDREKRIKSVSLADINAFAKTFIKPDQLTFFIAGEPEGFEEVTQKGTK